MSSNHWNVAPILEASIQQDEVLPASKLLDRVVAQGYSRDTAIVIVCKGFRQGVVARSGKAPRYDYRRPGTPPPAGAAAVPAARTERAPATAHTALPAYAGPTFATGHPPIHTGTPCGGGDDELPPALGAHYAEVTGRLFDRAFGYLSHVE